MQRSVLILTTNMAIVLVLSLTMRLFGVEPYLTAKGLNLQSLLIFAAVLGFGGAFISLALSKWSAKRAMVLGHEMAHVASGDMVTLSLIQGVVNLFVMFLSRVMIAALQRLALQHPQPLPDKLAAFDIAAGGASGIKRLFTTHPPLEERIAALQAGVVR